MPYKYFTQKAKITIICFTYLCSTVSQATSSSRGERKVHSLQIHYRILILPNNFVLACQQNKRQKSTFALCSQLNWYYLYLHIYHSKMQSRSHPHVDQNTKSCDHLKSAVVPSLHLSSSHLGMQIHEKHILLIFLMNVLAGFVLAINVFAHF